MRMDYAMLSRLQLQSTSRPDGSGAVRADRRGRSRLAAPEQAGNWAYPQPGMPPEEIAFCLVNGLAGRLYLSGHLNRMNADELALVREGVLAYQGLRDDLARSVPFWPLGLPTSLDEVVVLGLRAPAATYLYLWFTQPGDHATLTLDLPVRVEGEAVETVYPRSLPTWEQEWDGAGRVLRIAPAAAGPTARVLRIARPPRRPRSRCPWSPC